MDWGIQNSSPPNNVACVGLGNRFSELVELRAERAEERQLIQRTFLMNEGRSERLQDSIKRPSIFLGEEEWRTRPRTMQPCRRFCSASSLGLFPSYLIMGFFGGYHTESGGSLSSCGRTRARLTAPRAMNKT